MENLRAYIIECLQYTFEEELTFEVTSGAPKDEEKTAQSSWDKAYSTSSKPQKTQQHATKNDIKSDGSTWGVAFSKEAKPNANIMNGVKTDSTMWQKEFK